MESSFMPAGPVYLRIIFITVMHLSRRFFRVVGRSSMHKLKLGFVKRIITPIGLIRFTNLNAMHFRTSVLYVID